jgi:hypothetical protein
VNYTYLREGDQLPAVGVLQKLLNRTGTSLVTDGIFGTKTLAAVRAFQFPRGLGHSGVVGEATWRRLTSDVHLPILDCVDVWDPTFFQQDAAYIRKEGGHLILIGGACNGVEQAVDLIRNQERNVFLLRFHGHGGPGVASVASGQGELDPKMRQRSDISEDPLVLRSLQRLRPVFGRYGCVQFIECETGRGHKGRHLLTRLAAELGVPVTAAVNDQPFGRGPTFRLEGPTITAVPGGSSLRNWCMSRPDFVGYCAA